MFRGHMGIHVGEVRGVSQLLTFTNGCKIPSLGFGTYRIPETEVGPAVKFAVECGFRHIDCAKIYLNEGGVGVALRDLMKDKKVTRDNLFITSKIWPTDQHPDNVEKACRDTLARLQLDYLDLYLIHWPIIWKHTGKFESDDDRRPQDANGMAIVDKSAKLSDTWQAMTRLVDMGLVRSLGLSNCDERHMNELMDICSKPEHCPVINQVEYHPGCNQTELWATNHQNGLLTSSYCPLGMPTRFTAPDFEGIAVSPTLKPLSVSTGFSVPRVLLNWNLDFGNVVIVKSTKKEHIIDNSKACRFALSDSVRWLLNHYEEQFQSVRVINPSNFTEDGKPFFPPRNVKLRRHQP